MGHNVERTDEDLALTSGRNIASPAEYQRRILAALLRIEDALLAGSFGPVPETAVEVDAPKPRTRRSK